MMILLIQSFVCKRSLFIAMKLARNPIEVHRVLNEKVLQAKFNKSYMADGGL